MPEQEFLASFGVKTDESGLQRLQSALEENRVLAEEAAAAFDRARTPVQTFFRVVMPMMKPTLISVGVLEIMWVWNDYLLPYLVLDVTQYKTIPIHIQYLQGSYGRVDLGATMALIILSLIPIIIFYLTCQRHIIKGVAAGAVKG